MRAQDINSGAAADTNSSDDPCEKRKGQLAAEQVNWRRAQSEVCQKFALGSVVNFRGKKALAGLYTRVVGKGKF